MSDIPELTSDQMERAISARLRKRLIRGKFETAEDIAALRRFVGLTQTQFAQAMGISVHTLRNWEQGRRHPEWPAIALLRIAARHPRILRENLESAALTLASPQARGPSHLSASCVLAPSPWLPRRRAEGLPQAIECSLLNTLSGFSRPA